MKTLTHIDTSGDAVMVDVSEKAVTTRRAVAVGRILLSPECFDLVERGAVKKGDVLGVARLSGIMGAKRTAETIPLCHALSLSSCAVTFQPLQDIYAIEARCTVSCEGKTGAEMEALVGVSTALLTIYDMCKAIDKRMVISDIHLEEKQGGKSGDFYFKDGE